MTPWTVAARFLCPWDFPGKNTGGGRQFPLPGDLPDLGIKPISPALASRFFTTEPPEKPPEISVCKIPIVISIEKLCNIFSYQRAKQNIWTAESSAVLQGRSTVPGKEPSPACHVLASGTSKLPSPKHLFFSSLELNLQTSLFSTTFLYLRAALSCFTHV